VKHGIDFGDCAEIFADPWLVLVKSPVAASEARFLAIGALRGRLVTVIFTPRGAKLRLISARAARRNERERYGRQAQTKG
jgi:uncharacterized DUF497 family protein